MRSILKWVAIAVGTVVAIAGALIVYIATTFDPNDYKATIVKTVKDRTGRTLALKGDLKLSFFPTLGAKLGETALSERDSNADFASVSEALVAVKLLPLLSKQIIVDAVEVKGLKARVEKDKAGKFNFDDLKGESAATTQNKSEPSRPSLMTTLRIWPSRRRTRSPS